MKISLLLDREPFAAIFEATMERHLRAVTGRPHRVTWTPRSRLDRGAVARRPGTWLCNPLINAIFSASARPEVFAIPLREHGAGATTLRRAVHRSYALAATSALLRDRLAEHVISIEPEIPNAAHLLIAGGNTRVRIFDFLRGEATTVLKERFDPAFVTADLAVRRAHLWLPAPPVLRVLDGGRAYAEPILKGGNAARLADPEAKRRALAAAVAACDRLAEETARRVPFSTYLTEVLSACRTIARRLEAAERRTAERAIAWIDGGEERNASRNARALDIEIGESHGDLQAGNVLVHEDEIRLVDWERTAVRMRGYDEMTLALESRRGATGLAARARRWLAERDGGTADARERRLLLFLAEELRFHLEENVAGPIAAPTPGLALLLDELEKERGATA